ncbi:hypothetical protein Tco_1110020 [Tanacetum coccineum]|uniref:Uncharacterized protein n=1 Tax=Tanacetum coccineum TaxID=301880 RepID=A0ABQ5IHM3_9ASTR
MLRQELEHTLIFIHAKNIPDMNSVRIFELDLEVEVLQKPFEELKQERTRDKELFAEAKKRIESNMKENLSFMR